MNPGPDERTTLRERIGSRAMRCVIGWLRNGWALPNTLMGGLFVTAALLSGGHVRLVQGAIEAEGGLVKTFLKHAIPMPGGAAALTLGHVVLGRDPRALVQSRAIECSGSEVDFSVTGKDPWSRMRPASITGRAADRAGPCIG